MNRPTELMKTPTLGGFFIVLPILLLYLMIGAVFGLVVALAMQIADLLPRGTFEKVNFPVLMALLLILMVSFALGLPRVQSRAGVAAAESNSIRSSLCRSTAF